jgi:hypothetical protein
VDKVFTRQREHKQKNVSGAIRAGAIQRGLVAHYSCRSEKLVAEAGESTGIQR